MEKSNLTTNEEFIRNLRESDPVKIRNSFHSEFILFRKALQLKRIFRKTKIDSLLKKCKSKVFRTIQEAINLLSNINNKDIRLPQSFITNINIEENKRWLNTSLLEIYQEFQIMTDFDEWTKLHYVQPQASIYLKILMELTYKEAFEAYLKSSRYISDYNYIKQREGEKYAILYDYVSKVFINYFLYGKGNRKKNLKQEALDMEDEVQSNKSILENLDLKANLKLKQRKKIHFIKSRTKSICNPFSVSGLITEKS